MKINLKFTISLLLVCFTTFFISSQVFAQMEAYMWKSSFIKSGKLNLKISTEYAVGGDYTSADITEGINRWKNTSANLNLSSASFASSNVDIRTVNSQTWNNNGWGSNTYAWTQPFDGTFACATNLSTNKCTSSNSIDYAAIYINSSKDTGGLLSSTKQDRRRGVIAHELGHAFTIHHNSLIGATSVMKTSMWHESNFSVTPTSTDINDFNRVYK
ncbi:M48 family metalloprotease [Paenibacillus sp. FSL R5-0519]|uniref:M48 family metalloprotease n=1 Tax=Paenibacillus sp. FSL R5-0519 TaxID=2921648 RepID=UPI0030DC52BC